MRSYIIWVLAFSCIFTMVGGAEKVNVVDYKNHSVSIDAPVHKVVSLGTGVAEYLYALDGGQCLMGRDSYSFFPPGLQNVAIAGKSSYSPDLELIVKLHPDLVIADGMLSSENRKKMEDAGIPVIVDSLSDPDRSLKVMDYLGTLLGKKERSSELIGFIQKYHGLVQERTASLKPEDKPDVFFEWAGTPYYTVSKGTSSDNLITSAGGVNIASDVGNKTNSYPHVTPEWVSKIDPDVIIQTESSTKPYTDDDLKKFWEAIVQRPELKKSKAVNDGRVYVISGEIRYGTRYIISELYLAKWFHPKLFEDIDPESVHKELIEKFYGLNSTDEAYAYPLSQMA